MTTTDNGAEKLHGLKLTLLAGTLGPGGAERQLMYLTRELVSAGVQVRVLSLTDGEHYEAPLKSLGVPVHWVGKSPSKLNRLHRIMGELRADRPHIIQSTHFHTNLYAAAAGRWLKIPSIGAMRSNGTNEVRATGRILGRMCLTWPDVLVANSTVALRYAESRGISTDRLHHLPNVIDTSIFRPVQRVDRTPVRILAAGRLGPEKRFDRFLRIIAQLKQSTEVPIEAWLAGAGPLDAKLKQQAWDLGLSGITRFLGNIQDMMLIYPEVDMLALTSDWEGSPNVLIEAMATGLPVTATRVGGVPDLLPEMSGAKLVEADDEAEMVSILKHWIESSTERNNTGKLGTHWVQAQHAIAGLQGRADAIYSKLL